MNREDWRLARTLEWVARLPLCGEPELAGLAGIDPIDARQLVEALARRGWVESIAPGSPELELRRRWLVREPAVPALAAMLGITAADVTRRAPVGLNGTLDRVSRVEVTAGVNRLLSHLAADLRRSRIADLVDALSLPLALPAPERWWLPRVEGYGCLRSGNLWAPFFVAWDRAGAPDVYRRRRIAAWSAAIAAVAAHWGADGTPPILVVCPSLRELRVWEQALLPRLDDGSADRLDALLTTREGLRARGTGWARWGTPGTDRPISLVEGLGWGAAPPVQPLCLPDDIEGLRKQPSRTAPSLREWASAREAHPGPRSHQQQIAILALATTPEEQVLLEWVARHPLLSAAELSALLDESAALVARRLDRLARWGAIGPAAEAKDDSEEERSMNDAHKTRYLLTELGVRSLAARQCVPAATFARHSGVTFVGGNDPSPERALRHRHHTIGINRFFARLATDARIAGWRLDEWRNEAESTRRFVDEAGRWSWIRPDGSGVLLRGSERRPFLLEYDRGTLDAGDYHAKFEGYRRYFAGRRWESDLPSKPVLLFVCSNARAESRMAPVAHADAGDLPLLLTSEWRYEHATRKPTGLLGSVWAATTGSGRTPLVGACRSTNPVLRTRCHITAAEGDLP